MSVSSIAAPFEVSPVYAFSIQVTTPEGAVVAPEGSAQSLVRTVSNHKGGASFLAVPRNHSSRGSNHYMPSFPPPATQEVKVDTFLIENVEQTSARVEASVAWEDRVKNIDDHLQSEFTEALSFPGVSLTAARTDPPRRSVRVWQSGSSTCFCLFCALAVVGIVFGVVFGVAGSKS
jgi:hypothetical protein